MDKCNYFEKQEELMNLQEELRKLKRDKSMREKNIQLTTLNNMWIDLQDSITSITSNMTALSESATTIQSVLYHPLKISVGEENVQTVKRTINAAVQLTSDIDSVESPQETILFDQETTHFLQNATSHEEKAQLFCIHNKLLTSNVSQLLNEALDKTTNKHQNTDDNGSAKLESDHGSRLSSDSTINFSTANVISSSPI